MKLLQSKNYIFTIKKARLLRIPVVELILF